MTPKIWHLVLLTGAIVSLAACSKTDAPSSAKSDSHVLSKSASPDDSIASAESAAPAKIGRGAAIVVPEANGSMKTLRAGTNGWTCMPDVPSTPGPDPMCWDANAGKWLDTWMAHKAPPAGLVGVIYMLAGGSDAGNTDPYADKPHQGEDWVTTGPHIMIVGSKEVLTGYPRGVKPDTSVPYVMWDGTPYAHLMVPVR